MAHEDDGERLVQLARDAIVHELGGPVRDRPVGRLVRASRRPRSSPSRGAGGCTAASGASCRGARWPRTSSATPSPRRSRTRGRRPSASSGCPRWASRSPSSRPLERMRVSGEEDALRQIVPGIDGLVLRRGPYRGTFLPQVWESLPEPRDFLAELKVKAGLERAFWDDEVELYRFRVEKWGDRRAVRAGALAVEA